jgi:hypothetical protein
MESFFETYADTNRENYRELDLGDVDALLAVLKRAMVFAPFEDSRFKPMTEEEKAFYTIHKHAPPADENWLRLDLADKYLFVSARTERAVFNDNYLSRTTTIKIPGRRQLFFPFSDN